MQAPCNCSDSDSDPEKASNIVQAGGSNTYDFDRTLCKWLEHVDKNGISI